MPKLILSDECDMEIELEDNEAIAVCEKCKRLLGVIKRTSNDTTAGIAAYILISCPNKGEC